MYHFNTLSRLKKTYWNLHFNVAVTSWILTSVCWFCLLKVNRTRVFSQPTRRSPVTEQQATATGRSDRGISMISICTPPRTDAPRSRWPNKRTPTRALSSACIESKTFLHKKNKTFKGGKIILPPIQPLQEQSVPWLQDGSRYFQYSRLPI